MNSFWFEHFEINPISERDGWPLWDFTTSNQEYLKRYFPITVNACLTPVLSNLFVLEKMAEFATGKEFLFTLKEHEHRKIIGLVFLKQIDHIKQEAEIAYCIEYSHKNKGFATQALQSLSNWAFTEQNLNYLHIIVHASNLGSIKVAKNCGYLWQRTLLNEHIPPTGKPLDMELYIVKHER